MKACLDVFCPSGNWIEEVVVAAVVYVAVVVAAAAAVVVVVMAVPAVFCSKFVSPPFGFQQTWLCRLATHNSKTLVTRKRLETQIKFKLMF